MNKGFYSDAYLIKQARKGDQGAHNRLLERYYPKIQQIIYQNINDQTYVHDLSQEVLLKVFRYLHDFKEQSQFSTWLYRIIQNTLKNHFRDVSLRLDSEAQFAQEQQDLTLPFATPEHQAINMEFNQHLESAIDQLSEELRLCYGMHVFEGQTYDDIAKAMHCPIGTVRSRISRARKLMMDFVGLEHYKA